VGRNRETDVQRGRILDDQHTTGLYHDYRRRSAYANHESCLLLPTLSALHFRSFFIIFFHKQQEMQKMRRSNGVQSNNGG
jgi:hypothetical protein